LCNDVSSQICFIIIKTIIMNFKSKIKIKEIIRICLFALIMSLVAIYAKSISNYLIDSYNDKVDFLASNTVKGRSLIRY